MLLKPCPSIIRRNASTLVGSHGFFRVQRSVHGFVGLLALCSTAAFSLFSNGILAVPLAHYSSASAPDFHRLPLFSLFHHRPQNRYAVFRQKKKPHRQTSAGVTDCSHILPSFHPFQGALRRSRMVGILTRTSQRTTPPALAPSLLRFYPNDQITPLRMRTFCAYSYGYSTGISPDSLISTSAKTTDA